MNEADGYIDGELSNETVRVAKLKTFTPELREKAERCMAYIEQHGRRRKNAQPTLYFITYASYNLPETDYSTYDQVFTRLKGSAEIIHYRYEDGRNNRPHLHVICNIPKRVYFKSLSSPNISLDARPIFDVDGIIDYLSKEDRHDTKWFRTNYAF